MPDPVKITRRNLPHWSREGSIYFITFRLARGEMSVDERKLVFDHLLAGDPRFYRLHACAVMPDHVHAIIRPNRGIDVPRMMKGIKGVSARLVNESRQTRGGLWQDESFDRILRDETEFERAWNYIIENPSKTGLVERSADYPFLWLAD